MPDQNDDLFNPAGNVAEAAPVAAQTVAPPAQQAQQVATAAPQAQATVAAPQFGLIDLALSNAPRYTVMPNNSTAVLKITSLGLRKSKEKDNFFLPVSFSIVGGDSNYKQGSLYHPVYYNFLSVPITGDDPETVNEKRARIRDFCEFFNVNFDALQQYVPIAFQAVLAQAAEVPSFEGAKGLTGAGILKVSSDSGEDRNEIVKFVKAQIRTS